MLVASSFFKVVVNPRVMFFVTSSVYFYTI
jgi:hypothetical protein